MNDVPQTQTAGEVPRDWLAYLDAEGWKSRGFCLRQEIFKNRKSPVGLSRQPEN